MKPSEITYDPCWALRTQMRRELRALAIMFGIGALALLFDFLVILYLLNKLILTPLPHA